MNFNLDIFMLKLVIYNQKHDLLVQEAAEK